MTKQSAQSLIQSARRECQAIAQGEFTPVVFERYEYIGGERGWRLGYPTETETGLSAVVWSDRSQWPALRPA